MQTVCNTYRDAGKGNLTAQNKENPSAAAGELTALPQTPYLVGMGWLPLPKNPSPAVGPSGLASPTPVQN